MTKEEALKIMKAIPKFGGSVFNVDLSEFKTKEEWKIIAMWALYDKSLTFDDLK